MSKEHIAGVGSGWGFSNKEALTKRVKLPMWVLVLVATIVGGRVTVANPISPVVETMVLSSNGTPVTSSTVLSSGQQYWLLADGTYNRDTAGHDCDAEWCEGPFGPPWVEVLPSDPPTNAELIVNSTERNWLGSALAAPDAFLNFATFEEHAYSPSHVYWLPITGNGSTFQLQISDAFTGDNSGSLTVRLFTECDDFDDGTLNSALWAWGGNPDRGVGGGSWQFSHEEIVGTDGYAKLRVWGPTSGATHGAEAWIRTQYDYNDGLNYIINFRWGADVNASHIDAYAIQITDGTIPGGLDLFWFGGSSGGIDGAGWRNIYLQAPQSDMPPSDWSMHIDGRQNTAMLFGGPNLTGPVLGFKTLPGDQPWYVRFILSDGTSAGFPAGDNVLAVYDYCSAVTSEGLPVPTVSQWGLIVMAGLVAAAGGSIVAKRRRAAEN